MSTSVRADIEVDVDTGYLGIGNIHSNSVLPRKKSKHHPLSKEDILFRTSIHKRLSKVWKCEILTTASAEATEIS